MTQFCSHLDQEEKQAESLDSFNILDNFRAMKGGGSIYSYCFIDLFHVLEHLGHFKAIKNIPDNRLGPLICS